MEEEQQEEEVEITYAAAIGGLLVTLLWLVMIGAWFVGIIRSMMPEPWGR